jgi:two-component system invasion response regulator UvrY
MLLGRVPSVLIVDDQEVYRSVTRQVVAAADGLEVAGEAPTGEAAIEAVLKLRPDLVLLDVNLPGIDGFEACRRIRAADSRAVVVLMSTRSAEEYAGRTVSCGATAYIPKAEFSAAALAAIARRAGF